MERFFFGKYNMEGRLYDFRFDLDEDLYRIHSEVWIPVIGSDTSGRYECFDLVSNYDFLIDVGISILDQPERVRLASFDVPISIKEPVFVEPFSTSRKPDYPYSCIGPWHGDIILGQSIEFFVPYITQSVTVDPGEIMYDFCWVDMSEWLCAESERHYMIRDVCDVCLIGRTDLCLKNEIHPIIGVPKAANDLGFYFKKSYKVPRKKDKHKILDGEIVEHKEDRGDPVEQKKKNRKEGQGRVVVFKQIKDRGKLFFGEE